jgi:hypothetical protein
MGLSLLGLSVHVPVPIKFVLVRMFLYHDLF